MNETKLLGKRIPISKAKQIANDYNYDHVIIMAWNTAEGKSWWTTYGKDKAKCAFALNVAESLNEHF